jgi:hypothetical protein
MFLDAADVLRFRSVVHSTPTCTICQSVGVVLHHMACFNISICAPLFLHVLRAVRVMPLLALCYEVCSTMHMLQEYVLHRHREAVWG